MKAIMRDKSELKDSGIEYLGHVPKNWKLASAKFFVSIANGSDPKTDGDVPVYGSGKGSFRTCGESKEGPAVLLGRKGTVDIPQYIEGKYWNVDTAFDVKAKSGYVLRFFYYLSTCFDYKRYSTQTALPSMTQTNYNSMRIIVPDISEQEDIISYLDDCCSKIDAIIDEAKASIEEYKELKQAVIYEAITKGLDKTVDMKIYNDWFDKCPSNWEYKQIRYLYELRDERNFKPLSEVNLISLYTDQGVIQHADIEKTSGNKAVTADGYKKVYPEDIVVNIILCWMGAMGRSEYEGVTSPAYDVYKPIGCSKVCSRYYHYLFRTDRFSKKCYTVGRGIMMMRWRTYSSQFRAIKVPVPPYNEQIEIANYLDKRISNMEELINAKQSLIKDLEAYKKSLIYEVVTGKRKVVA